MKIISLTLCFGFLNLLNAQTIAYKCTDTSDSQYWQYFNIDHDSLHFKAGETTIMLTHKRTTHKQGKSIHVFSNSSLTFNVTQKTHDFTKVNVTDGKYSYSCKMEQIFSDFTNKYALTN